MQYFKSNISETPPISRKYIKYPRFFSWQASVQSSSAYFTFEMYTKSFDDF
jgi:hypothetical protein